LNGAPDLAGSAETSRRSRIRELNDVLRTTGRGGRIVITTGIAALAPDAIPALLAAVAGFESFDPDNDPYGEQDCAVLTVGAERVIWKIDYYDRSLSGHSPDPADPAVTTRILTIMLAEEH
jgi:uncharacterized protein DUF3768